MLIPNSGLGEPINQNKQRSYPTSGMIYSKLRTIGAVTESSSQCGRSPLRYLLIDT